MTKERLIEGLLFVAAVALCTPLAVGYAIGEARTPKKLTGVFIFAFVLGWAYMFAWPGLLFELHAQYGTEPLTMFGIYIACVVTLLWAGLGMHIRGLRQDSETPRAAQAAAMMAVLIIAFDALSPLRDGDVLRHLWMIHQNMSV